MKKYFVLFAVFFLLEACTEEASPVLLSVDRKIVDSLYMQQVNLIKPVMDSLCDKNYEKRVKQAVDSMLQVRQSEIEEYLERLKTVKVVQ